MKTFFNGDTRERKYNQTAVEWLQEQLFDSLGIKLTEHQLTMANEVFFEQAKEMEANKLGKYDEMLEMLKRIYETETDFGIRIDLEQLIKEATELKS